MRYLVVLAALALGACQTAQQQTAAPVPCTPDNDRASGNGICLVAHSFGAGNAGASPALYVVIHGDVSSGGPATYHLGPAEELGAPAGSVAIGLVRPGYSGKGASSEGSNNNVEITIPKPTTSPSARRSERLETTTGRHERSSSDIRAVQRRPAP
jgi:hypothetical protein